MPVAKKTRTTNRISGNGQEERVEIAIRQFRVGRLKMRLHGDSPLIVHAWSEKAKKMMLDKQRKQPAKAREVKLPEEDFVEALYWLEGDKPTLIVDEETGIKRYEEKNFVQCIKNGVFGLPCNAVKKSFVGSARFVDGLKMTELKGVVFFRGAKPKGKVKWNTEDFAVIQGTVPRMREDIARVANGNPDLRYRPEFATWYCDIEVEWNASFLSTDQLVNLLNLAGFSQGLLEMRPERGGNFGRFSVESLS